ncbi:MAG: hypothetical protein AAFY73_02220 [Pseudomonadota bacterium]
MIRFATEGETRPKALGKTGNRVARKAAASQIWTLVTVTALPLVAGFGSLVCLAIAPTFSGSTIVAALVVLAVATALGRSRLGAVDELEAERLMHGDTAAPRKHT